MKRLSDMCVVVKVSLSLYTTYISCFDVQIFVTSKVLMIFALPNGISTDKFTWSNACESKKIIRNIFVFDGLKEKYKNNTNVNMRIP